MFAHNLLPNVEEQTAGPGWSYKHHMSLLLCYYLLYCSLQFNIASIHIHWLVQYPISCVYVLPSWCFSINKYCNTVNLSDRAQSWSQLKVWQGFFIGIVVQCMLLEWLPWVNMNKSVNVFQTFCPDLRLDYFCIAVNFYPENVLNW